MRAQKVTCEICQLMKSSEKHKGIKKKFREKDF